MAKLIGIALYTKSIEGVEFAKDEEFEIIGFKKFRDMHTLYYDRKGKPVTAFTNWYYDYVVKVDNRLCNFTLENELFTIIER